MGQSIEFRPVNADGWPNMDEALVVNISVPPGGWGLMYDNSITGVGVVSVNGSLDRDGIELQWAGEWEEMEAQCFIDPSTARDAARRYLSDGTLSPHVTWTSS